MWYNHTPSAKEFTGYYNVPKPTTARRRKQAYLHTVHAPPLLTLDEATKVARDALDVVCASANHHAFTPAELRKYYWSSTSFVQVDDRTLHVSVDPHDYTFDLIKQLQRFLLLDYPLWRVQVTGGSHDTTIMIYPAVVRYGSLSDEIEEEDALSRILQGITAEQPRSYWITKAHHAIVREAARVAIRVGLSDRITVLVGFDNYEGDFTQVTMWTLCKTDTPELSLPPTIQFMVANQYYCTDSGDFGCHVGDDAPYWVEEWIFPGRELPLRLPFIAFDANYESITVETDVRPLNFVKEALD